MKTINPNFYRVFEETQVFPSFSSFPEKTVVFRGRRFYPKFLWVPGKLEVPKKTTVSWFGTRFWTNLSVPDYCP